MIRALSTRKDRGGYKKLGGEKEEEAGGVRLLEGKEQSVSAEVKKPVEKTGGSVHPLFSFFDVGSQRRKNKKKRTTTAKPEFSRYMEYVKEGGVWDATSNGPVIYYK
ncbi:hypothetical protein N665_0171s0008 [Sinapis alba]|nr:hypothetical protein N665_0171s0008 [Sinapis alba]